MVLAVLTEMRLALEPAMASLAAQRATPEQTYAILAAVDAAACADGDRTFALANPALHCRLIEASGNMLIYSACSSSILAAEPIDPVDA